MEGELQKQEGFFNSFTTYHFILHEDTLMQMDIKKEKILTSIHLKVAKIQNVLKEPTQISIFNGTSEIILRAASIKEKVEWTNALVQA